MTVTIRSNQPGTLDQFPPPADPTGADPGTAAPDSWNMLTADIHEYLNDADNPDVSFRPAFCARISKELIQRINALLAAEPGTGKP